MLINPTPPTSLETFQLVMGAAITTPYAWDDDGTYRLTPEKYPALMLDQINGQNDIQPSDRLRVYNSGYWNRLFSILQDELPLLVHLLGYDEFNRFASSYLQAFPSASPILNKLCDRLPDFFALTHDWNTDLLIQAAELEYCYIKAFDAPQLPPLDPETLPADRLESLPERPLTVQAHATLFEEDWNLVESRQVARSTEDDALILQPETRSQHWLIYRSLGNAITPVKMSPTQRNILSQLMAGQPFATAIENSCKDLPPDDLSSVAAQLPKWFADWTSYGIFSLEQPSPQEH